LRALCLGLARQHVDLLNQLKAAEADPQALKQAELMFAELPSTVRRRILALYAELARPFVVAPRLANKD